MGNSIVGTLRRQVCLCESYKRAWEDTMGVPGRILWACMGGKESSATTRLILRRQKALAEVWKIAGNEKLHSSLLLYF